MMGRHYKLQFSRGVVIVPDNSQGILVVFVFHPLFREVIGERNIKRSFLFVHQPAVFEPRGKVGSRKLDFHLGKRRVPEFF